MEVFFCVSALLLLRFLAAVIPIPCLHVTVDECVHGWVSLFCEATSILSVGDSLQITRLGSKPKTFFHHIHFILRLFNALRIHRIPVKKLNQISFVNASQMVAAKSSAATRPLALASRAGSSSNQQYPSTLKPYRAHFDVEMEEFSGIW